MERKALVSPVKTVVQVVSSLERSRAIYEKGLGLKCVGEGYCTTEDVGSIWGEDTAGFRIARLAREGENFGCVDLVENPDAIEKMRDSKRAFDYGIMTLNFRTNDIDMAFEKLIDCGAEPVSEILEYNVGKPIREVMMITPCGERMTIIEVGGKNTDLPVFNEAIATVGMVVPTMADTKRFYSNALELETSIEFQAAGSPFDALLGVPQLDGLDFATLTSDGIWTGKVELLQLSVPATTAINTSELADLCHTGYSFVTFLANDLGAVTANCRESGASIIVEPAAFNRPFHEGSRIMIVRSPGGEYIEIIEESWD